MLSQPSVMAGDPLLHGHCEQVSATPSLGTVPGGPEHCAPAAVSVRLAAAAAEAGLPLIELPKVVPFAGITALVGILARGFKADLTLPDGSGQVAAESPSLAGTRAALGDNAGSPVTLEFGIPVRSVVGATPRWP